MTPADALEPGARLPLVLACPIFRGLAPEQGRVVADLAHERRARRRGTFFSEGQPATAFFVLATGRVKIAQVSHDGAEVILRLIAPGQMFGGFGALIGGPYPATAQALESSRALAWDASDMEALMQRFPVVASNLVRELARRLRELEVRYRELATERVAQRLAHALLRLGERSGRPVSNGLFVDVPLSREDLAQLTGTTLFSVSRLLSEWEARGLLQARRGRLVLCDLPGLRALAEAETSLT